MAAELLDWRSIIVVAAVELKDGMRVLMRSGRLCTPECVLRVRFRQVEVRCHRRGIRLLPGYLSWAVAVRGAEGGGADA